MFNIKSSNQYKLKLSTSYKMLKDVFPGNLYFIAREWLTGLNNNSKINISEFDELYNNGNKSIKKNNEELLIREIHRNGFALSTLENTVSKKKDIFCTQMLIIQTVEETLISCKLISTSNYYFSKKQSPKIMRLMLDEGKGGRNGNIPISKRPITYELNVFENEQDEILKNILLPVILIKCGLKSRKIGLANSLAKELYAEASVILIKSELILEEDESILIKYPDGTEEKPKQTPTQIIKIIRANYYKQVNIENMIDKEILNFIPEKLYLPDSNYSKLVLAGVLESLSKEDRLKLKEALKDRYIEDVDFDSKVDDIIYLRTHSNILKSLSNNEILEIFTYLGI